MGNPALGEGAGAAYQGREMSKDTISLKEKRYAQSIHQQRRREQGQRELEGLR